VLSTNFGCVMPAGHDPKGFDLPISGGPMKIESFDEEGVLRTSKFEITPNKYKFAVAGMTLRTGIPKDEIQALYETGEISLLTDGMKWDSTSKNTAPSYEPPQEQSISAGLTYLALNTKLPPFDDVNIRRAVNYAINRTKLTELLGHAARPTSQILPPLFPERDDTISVDVYDPGKAASLLTGVDTPLEVDLYAVDDPMFRTMVDSIVQDLKAVGILVSPKYGSHQQIQSIGTDPDRGQMVFSDGLGWIPDYFHCSNFYFPLLSPTAIGGSGWNWSVYENLKVEQLVWHAESLLRDTQGEGRKSLWRHIFSLILDDAPIIPLYNRFQAATWVNSPSGEDTIPATSIGYLKTTSA
jgi:ABC-type transport system substrate-binding protein